MKKLNLRSYLKKELKRKCVRKGFEEENLPARIAIMRSKVREQQHLSQVRIDERDEGRV